MRYVRPRLMQRLMQTGLVAIGWIAALAISPVPPGFQTAKADETSAYAVEVNDVSAKVGEPTVLHATLRVRDGYRVLESYNNRVMELSSFDDGVAFDRRVVRATLRDGELDFAIGVRPTTAGSHPINGYFRVGYIHGADEFAMVSLRLVAKVNGTE